MIRLSKILFALTFITIGTLSPALADPIVGTWRTGDGPLVNISKCGAQFCVDVADGEFKGKRSGKLAKKGNGYSGKLKQFSTGISFTGSATVNGRSMKLIAKKFGITVKQDTWTKL